MSTETDQTFVRRTRGNECQRVPTTRCLARAERCPRLAYTGPTKRKYLTCKRVSIWNIVWRWWSRSLRLPTRERRCSLATHATWIRFHRRYFNMTSTLSILLCTGQNNQSLKQWGYQLQFRTFAANLMLRAVERDTVGIDRFNRRRIL